MTNIKNNSHQLILITAKFPFGKAEPFIETELPYLAKYFNDILIISHDLKSSDLRNIPNNIKVHRCRYNLNFYEKILSLFQIFSKLFITERSFIKNNYNRNLSLGLIKTMIISLQNAKRLSKVYKNISNKKNPIFYSYWCNDSAIALAILRKKFYCKTISRIHGWDVYFEPSKYGYLPFRNLLSNNLDNIHSISVKGIDYCSKVWKVYDNNFVLSRLGINQTLSKKKINFSIKSKNEIVVVSCSNLIPLKRIDLIINSLSLLNVNQVKWVHFGTGEMFEDLKLLAAKNLPKSVNFIFMGNIPNFELMNWYSNNTVDLFINTSSTEGIPVSIMEAMSFGIPCFATNVGGVSEIVSNKNGVLFDENPTPQEIANSIMNYVNLSTADKKAIRLEAFFTWKEKFNANSNYTNFAEKLNDLCINF